jgi:hypothetical protein
LSITVNYKGLTNSPLLLTPGAKRSEGPEPDEASGPDLNTAMGLYQGSQTGELKLRLRELEQERVVKATRARMAALALSIEQLNIPQSDVIKLEKTAKSPTSALEMEADRDATVPNTHTLNVHWPARGRSFLTKPANPIDNVELSDGQHSYTMNIDGEDHTLTVEVNKTPGEVDTQEEFLGKLANSINAEDSRISAEVEYSFSDAYDENPRSQPMDRVVRLKVYSNQDGRGVDFYFSDVDEGSVISTYGLDRSQPGRDAFLDQEGAARSQSQNSISLDDGHVTGAARDTTKGPVDVPVSQGAGVMQAELSGLIQQYNDLVRYMSAHADLLRPSLKDRIIRPLEDRAREVNALGLMSNASGTLTPGEGFYSQIENNFAAVRDILLDSDGWTQALAGKLSQTLAMDDEAFTAALHSTGQFEERRRAWALVGDVGQQIINGYV